MDKTSARNAQPYTRLIVRIAGVQIKKFQGRDGWALRALIDAGPRGISAIDNPAPRWASYIFNLRRAGLNIATFHESHGGAFADHHARYILRTPVEIVERVAA